MRKNLFHAAVLLITLGAATAACADKPPIGTPDPNAVTKQTVYQGNGTASLLILMQTVGMDPTIAVHKAKNGQIVGPLVTPGGVVHWTYYSHSTEPSGTDYPPHPSTTPPANYHPNLVTKPTGPTANDASNPAPGDIAIVHQQVGNVLYIYVFEYEFNFQTGEWEWTEVDYEEIPVNTKQK